MAAVSRPDICARVAPLASVASPLQWSDIYRINDLVKTMIERQPAAVLKYQSKAHVGAFTLQGRPGAAYGDQNEEEDAG